jgi:hypothetical protein
MIQVSSLVHVRNAAFADAGKAVKDIDADLFMVGTTRSLGSSFIRIPPSTFV